MLDPLLRWPTYAADVQAGHPRTTALGLAWTAVLAAGVVTWLIAPDIPVTQDNGSGCGRWNSEELAQHHQQLAVRLLPFLLLAGCIGAAWVVMHRAHLLAFATYSVGGLASVTLLLWQPVNVAYVWSQLLSIVVVPAAAVSVLIWRLIAVPKARMRSASPPGAIPLLALLPSFIYVVLVLWTRTPWIWTC